MMTPFQRVLLLEISGEVNEALINDQQAAGYRSFVWNGTNHLGESVFAGIYLFIIKAGEHYQKKDLII